VSQEVEVVPKKKVSVSEYSLSMEQQIIAEIHNEFDVTQDRLLSQAEALLLELHIPTETAIEKKSDRLKKLGFVNSETVKRGDELKQKRENQNKVIVTTKAQADLIKHYKQDYPFQKFLPESELNRICNKYGLIYAPTNHFIKDVPEKNLIEIENTPPLKKQDLSHDIFYFEVTRWWKECPDEIKKLLKGKVDCTGIMTSQSDTDAMTLAKKLGYNGSYNGYVYSEAVVTRIDRGQLFICAPSTHFNLDGLEKNGELGYYTTTKTIVNDPIVFRYCFGGIQVLSKWGLEASDEALVNEQMN
jgi:hypothetical protein